MKPPTIRELLDDPVYRAYVKRLPPPHPGLTYGKPWQVWARQHDGPWKTGLFATYQDAWALVVKYYRRPDVEDIALVSRRVFYPPPGEWRPYRVRNPRTKQIEIRHRHVLTFTWDAQLEWCPRCRRPSRFIRLPENHHALRRQPCLTEDDPFRCVYCGIRFSALPSIEGML